jgi:phosphoenolpyruvate synthase/pyruvate phosphate dikinase
LFISRASLPGEEEQYKVYHQVAAALKPNPVIIRTLDLGGDKFASHLQLAQEMNPFLAGARSVLPRAAGNVPRPVARHPPRQRRGQREDDVSDDFRPGRTEPGQRIVEKCKTNCARKKSRSTKTWKSAR